MKQKDIMLKWIEKGATSVPNVLLERYSQAGLTELEMMVVLHIHSFAQRRIFFPSFEELSARMSINSTECAGVIRSLMQKQLITIIEGEQIGYESYSLEPLWEKIALLFDAELRGTSKEQALTEEKDLYSLFEEEFGRPLSAIECETMAHWLDQDKHSPAVIKAALREAVLSRKLTFRYIDRILFDWKKQGIQTVDEAREQSKKFRKPAATGQVTKSEFAVPFYNWLEE